MPEYPMSEGLYNSLIGRREVLAPDGYVPVYHETITKYLEGIAENGLNPNSEKSNMARGGLRKLNDLIDTYRPEKLTALNVSRSSISAYPNLSQGHGFGGGEDIFKVKDPRIIKSNYQYLKKYHPQDLVNMGVSTLAEYSALMHNPEYLKTKTNASILEIYVDPEKSLVTDASFIEKMIHSSDTEGNTEEELQGARLRACNKFAARYWQTVITLTDFNNLYNYDAKKRVYLSKDPKLTKPTIYEQPEILIPYTIPQEYIRVL